VLVIGNTLVSLDILTEEFICNLEQCRGVCCVEGDSGAPLDTQEVEDIAGSLDAIKPYMTGEALYQLQSKGFYERDKDGDLVTQCLNGRECVFAFRENGIYSCAIEKANAGNPQTVSQKPLSCHLYPIRISSVGEYTALNYHRWDICSAACTLGTQHSMPVYKFLKNALTRAFGAEWYAELEMVAAEYRKEMMGERRR
jgi:hypothetical protein